MLKVDSTEFENNIDLYLEKVKDGNSLILVYQGDEFLFTSYKPCVNDINHYLCNHNDGC